MHHNSTTPNHIAFSFGHPDCLRDTQTPAIFPRLIKDLSIKKPLRIKLQSCFIMGHTYSVAAFEEKEPREAMAAVGAFHRAFCIDTVQTDDLKADAYRLRYRVYCEERGYEASDRFPGKQEIDKFDGRAIHVLVRHRQSGVVVGTVRLILRECFGSALPIEQTCCDILDSEVSERFSFRNQSIAEVSRFAVSKSAIMEILDAERSWDAHVDRNADMTLRSFQSISLGLIAALFQMSNRKGLDHWYALMEPALARHLSRLGIKFTKVGPLIEHRGKRQPMIADLAQLRRDIRRKNNDLQALICDLESARLTYLTPPSYQVSGRRAQNTIRRQHHARHLRATGLERPVGT